MSNINVHPRMARKRIVKNPITGAIIDWLDEENGGWIIRKGQIVNQARIDELAKIEEDKKIAGRAMAEQVTHADVPDRTAAPSRMDELEKRIDSQDAKLDAILAALKK